MEGAVGLLHIEEENIEGLEDNRHTMEWEKAFPKSNGIFGCVIGKMVSRMQKLIR